MLCNPTMKEPLILRNWLPEGWIRSCSRPFVNQSRARGGESRKPCRDERMSRSRLRAEEAEAGGIFSRAEVDNGE